MIKYSKVDLGQIEALLNNVGGEKGMKALLSGKAVIMYKEHVVDLDSKPLIRYGNWEIRSHHSGGKIIWDPSKVKLFVHKRQSGENIMTGRELESYFDTIKVFNANLLDYLLDHPYLIPEEWKKDQDGNMNHIFFWDTIYIDGVKGLHVRCLEFMGGHWRDGAYSLNKKFNLNCPALVPID